MQMSTVFDRFFWWWWDDTSKEIRSEFNLHAKQWENVKWFNMAEEQVWVLFGRGRSIAKGKIMQILFERNKQILGELCTYQQLSHFSILWCFPRRFPNQIEVRCTMPFQLLFFLTHPVNCSDAKSNETCSRRNCWLFTVYGTCGTLSLQIKLISQTVLYRCIRFSRGTNKLINCLLK